MRGQKQMIEGMTCRGSYLLGTACGECSRCKEEKAKLQTSGEFPLRKLESKILVDDKTWDEIQKKCDLFSTPIYFKINDNTISFKMHFSNKDMKARIFIYIAGVLRGGEKEELQKLFWNEKRRYLYSAKFRNKISKRHSKKKALEYIPNIDEVKLFYTPWFNSFSSLKNQYKKRFKEIYWVRK